MSERITINTPVRFNDKIPQEVDVVIIGGGVIGIFSALYMARQGLRVFVCEKGRVAGEQSSRNWGWIRQQGRDPSELPIVSHAVKLWHEINRETGGECGVHTAGTLYLARDEQTMQRYENWLKVAQEHRLDTERVSASDVEKRFDGHAKSDWIGGIVTPSDCRGEPWQAVPAVAKLAQKAGAGIRENCAVRALDNSAGVIQGVITEHGAIKCSQVVLAAGAWSSLFARRHQINIPQLSVRATVAKTTQLPVFYKGMAADNELALRRREDGSYSLALTDLHTVYVGPDSFRHFKKYWPTLKDDWRHMQFVMKAPTGFPDAWGTKRQWSETEITPFEQTRVLEPEPDLVGVERMRARFATRFPDIGKPSISTCWAGMIDAMPDVVPIVDRAPNVTNLIVATGMSGHGFGIGPGIGHIITNMVQQKPVGFDMSRFRFSRFTDGSALVLGPGL